MQRENDNEKSPYDYSDENVRRGLVEKDDANKIEEASKDDDLPKSSGAVPKLGQTPEGEKSENQETGLDLNQGKYQGQVPAG